MECEKKYTVYIHRLPNGKVYVGITSTKPEWRWQRGNGYKSNKRFFNAIQKYGWENISHEIVATGLTKQAACDLEKMLIQGYNSNNEDYGYNYSIGGELSALGVTRSEEAKKHLSELKKGVSTGKQSEETKRKRSESLKKAYAEGRKIPHRFTKEEQDKAHKSHIGKKYHLTEEGLKARKIGGKKSGETRRGIPRPDSHPRAKPIIQMLNGEIINIFMSKEEATKYGFTSSRIPDVCNGKQLKANGYQWEYM